ncbi:hypothetical protein R3W88_034197 [Solanum pinnatisectum]|uniref:Uncharacterized protein n=1 Tax=Solanum pinnatisectum TaxID=50273 RepID=A0AAV9JZ63_9SOLN|nr:hypothetical protein R3W88_034197 [Solanum pinnatisectum]
MQLRNQGYYVATPRFGLGFSLLEPFQISSKKEKEIASSHHTSVEKTKESKEGKTPQHTSMFERIGRLTPPVSAFEKLCHKDEEESSEQVEGDANISKTSIFHCLGSKKEVIIRKDVVGARKSRFLEAIKVFLGSQREDSNLIQSSYHITVEEGPHNDDTNVDVQEALPQLEDDVQSTIDDIKELNHGTIEDPRPTFISALLTPQEDRKYFKLLVE